MDFTQDIKRFSFRYDGCDMNEYAPERKVSQNGEKVLYEYVFGDGLKVVNICTFYRDFDACEWVTWYENTSDKPGKVLSDIWDADITVPVERDAERAPAFVPDPEKDTVIFTPKGSYWAADEFYCDMNHIGPSEIKLYKTSGGRSSQERAPFFNIHKSNTGVVFAVGWTGQWNCSIERKEESVRIKAGIEQTEFYLLPGEKIRTASFVIMEYSCSFDESQNKWRRLAGKYFSLIGSPGRAQEAPLCTGIWGGMTTKSVIERIKLIKENEIPVEYIWMDAGWYGMGKEASPDEYSSDWYLHTGDWRVNPYHHPDGLLEVAKAVKDAGLKFLLWFEPERVIKNVPAQREHPEYFLNIPDEDNLNCLLNLGNEAAWNYCFETISGIIEKLDIKIYRQDFNFDPLRFWRENDQPDRRGINEIKHIMGLYRLWDALLERFPELIIDNCASGGRRIDIETMRRSIPLWRSDYQCPANYKCEVSQAHNMQFSRFLPYSGTGSGRVVGDVYRIRSAYGGSLTNNFFYSEEDALPDSGQLAWIKKYLNEYLRVREYFYYDFYPLTDSLESDWSWNAVQFNRPEKGDGIIQAFRHEKSPFPAGIFRLRGLEENLVYRITDLDDGSFCDICGKELAESGFEIKTDRPRCAKLYLYKAQRS